MTRRLLGYLSGQVVPYARSEAVVKEVLRLARGNS